MNALLLGTGSKWGVNFTQTLVNNGYHCYVVTSKDMNINGVTTIKVDWNNLSVQQAEQIANTLPDLDLIFFSQNGGDDPGEWCLKNGNDFNEGNVKMWANRFWTDCQLPVFLVKKLENKINDNTKIGWMVTGFIKNEVELKGCWQWAGYGAKKYTNVSMARGFASVNHPGIFFCINPHPGLFEEKVWQERSTALLNTIKNITKEQNGHSLFIDGSSWW